MVLFAFCVTSMVAQSFTIGGTIWGEDDNNSFFDQAEKSWYNVKVELQKNSGELVASTNTDPFGNYKFVHNMAGNYKIVLPVSNFVSGGSTMD
ncbi:MAG: hypothetical protein IPN29_15980 [Saprospiraceae bacterium]|nr:hypothetical protein [Saprospiraceae bacterium]